MKRALRHIRILSDGRPGHENQSRGLAEALQRRCGARIEIVLLDPAGRWWSRVKPARRLEAGAEPPDLVIGAGHRTHLPLLAAARRFAARSVVIMKPTLPGRLFDLCLIPRHDLRRAAGVDAGNIVATHGALNRLPETAVAKEPRGLVLLGGPSRHHGWDGPVLLAALAQIVAARSALSWTVANSRRTPAGFLEQVAALRLPLVIAPHEQAQSGWLPAQLAAAEEAWVTEDSTSMVFEAITAGARVGLLPTPARRTGTRVGRAIDDAVLGGYATRYAQWREAGRLRPPGAPLHEAARCADVILERFFARD